MPVKSLSLILGTLGLLTLLILVLLRRDLRAALRSGPRWWRGLVTAGLVTLALITGACGRSGDQKATRADKAPKTAPPAAPALPDPTTWKEDLALHDRVEEICRGWAGEWPFDARGRTTLLRRIDAALQRFEAIRSTDGPRAWEAGMFAANLTRLKKWIGKWQPSGTLYRGAPLLPTGSDLHGCIRERVALLKSLAESGLGDRLAPAAALMTDLFENLLDLKQAGRVPGPGKEAWKDEAKKYVGEIEAALVRLGVPTAPLPADLTAVPGWEQVVTAWTAALPYQDLEKVYAVDSKQVDRLDRALVYAARRFCIMALAGLVTTAEIRILTQEVSRLRHALDRQRRYRWTSPFRPRHDFRVPGSLPVSWRLLHTADPLAKAVTAGLVRKPLLAMARIGYEQDCNYLLSNRGWLYGSSRQEISPSGDRTTPQTTSPREALILNRIREGYRQRFANLRQEARRGRETLAAFGALPLDEVPGKEPDQERMPPAQALATAPAWLHYLAVVREAREVALGRRGSHPYTHRGRLRLGVALDAVAHDLDRLATGGTLSVPERDLLAEDLADLDNRSGRFRHREQRLSITCYIMSAGGGGDSEHRLAARLPLLTRVLARGACNKVVMARILGGVTRELNALEMYLQTEDRKPKERRWARSVERKRQFFARTDSLLAKHLQPRGKPLALDGNDDWIALAGILQRASPLNKMRLKGVRYINATDRELSRARLTASRLLLSGHLTWLELRLLHAEIERLRQRAHGHRRDPFFRALFPWDRSDDSGDPESRLPWLISLTLPAAGKGDIRPEVLRLLVTGCKGALVDRIRLVDRSSSHSISFKKRVRNLVDTTTQAIQEMEEILARTGGDKGK